MEKKFRQQVYDTFSEVFETMFFTFLEPVEEIPTATTAVNEDGYIQADIAYHGPASGRFSLLLPRRLACNITMNFLGVDEAAVSDEQMLDTAKETANMAVGSLLGKIDPAGEAKLHIPEANLIEDLSLADLLTNPGVMLFRTDHGPFWVVFKG